MKHKTSFTPVEIHLISKSELKNVPRIGRLQRNTPRISNSMRKIVSLRVAKHFGGMQPFLCQKSDDTVFPATRLPVPQHW